MKAETRQKLKRLFSLFIACAIVLVDVGPHISAQAAEDEALREQLAVFSEEFPDGAFEFYETALEGEEGTIKELVVIRKGGVDKEATVEFKAVDISAVYGKDYLLTVKEGWFSTTLESGTDGTTLMENYEEEAKKAEAEAKEAESKAEEEENVFVSSGEIEWENTSSSSLSDARDTFLGTDSSILDWKEVTEMNESAEDMFEINDEAVNDYARKLMGTSTTLHFDEGEYKKVIQIEMLDDSVGESDEQIGFFLYDATGSVLGDVTTAYANIKDNDVKETCVYEMAVPVVYVDADQKTVTITVKRTSGTELYGTVKVYTEDKTAVAGTDYEKVSEEVIFPQGVTERTVTIPVTGVESESFKEFYVKLESGAGEISETRSTTNVVLPCSADVEKLLAGNSNDYKTIYINYDGGAASSNNFNTTSGKKQITKSAMDLSTAESISFKYRSNEGYRKYEKDCDDHWAYGREVKFYIGTSASNCKEVWSKPSDYIGETQVNITIPDNLKKAGMHLYMTVKATGENNSAKSYVTSKVSVTYHKYTFEIKNDSNITGSETSYIEQIISGPTSNDKKDGNRITLGSVVHQSGKNQITSIDLYNQGTDKLNLKVLYNSGVKNSHGVASSSDNVEFMGYKLLKNGTSNKFSGIIEPEDLVFSKAFIDKYKADYMSNYTFRVYPVFRVKSRTVILSSTYYEGASPSSKNNKNKLVNEYYYKGFGSDKVITCTALDTIVATALINDGIKKSVKDMSVVCVKTNNENTDAAKAKNYEDANKYAKNLLALSSSYVKVVENASLQSTLEPNVVKFTPINDGVTIVKAQVEQTSVEVSPLPGGSNLGKVDGSYIGGVTTMLEDGTFLAGDPSKVMTMVGVRRNKLYRVSSIVRDGYRIYWYDRTADRNNDGRIDKEDYLMAGGYTPSFTGVVGAGLSFTINSNFMKIQYDFERVTTQKDSRGMLDGGIYIEDIPIFATKNEKTSKKYIKDHTLPAENAIITIDNKTTSTDDEGYFLIEDDTYRTKDYVLTNVSYGGINYSYLLNPNTYDEKTLSSDYTIKVKDAHIYIVKDGDDKEIQANNMENKDAVYKLVIQTSTEEKTSVLAKKAVLRFYDASGVELPAARMDIEADVITDAKGNQNADSERFTFEFNPKELGLPAGTTMKVQFFDSEGFGYFNRETGISLKKSLGNMYFVNRFGFASSGVVNDMVGAVASQFGLDFGIDFSDEDSYTEALYVGFGTDNVKVIDENTELGEGYLVETIRTVSVAFDTLSVGNAGEKKNLVDKKYSDVGGAYQELAKGKKEAAQLQLDLEKKSEQFAAEKDQKKKDKLKAEIEQVSKDIEAKAKENETLEQKANEEMKKETNPSATRTDIALDAYVTVDVSMIVSMAYDEEVQDYYFKQMVLVADISGGLETKILISTPIGLDVTVTINVGLESMKEGESGSRSVITVRQRQDLPNVSYDPMKPGSVESSRIYMTSASEDEIISLLDFKEGDRDRAFDMSGTFRVSPMLGIACKVGISAISTYVELSVKAVFDLYFFTDDDIDNYATLTINGGLEISILGLYTHKFEYTSDPIDISGSSRNARATWALNRTVGDTSYLYESVDGMEIRQADEESVWQGNSTAATFRMLKARSAASAFISEKVLKTGAFEYPDVQIENIGGGKYLAVFLDYDTDREGINQTAVYYTIYDNGVWTEPELLEDDGTVDDSPVLENLGDKGIMVAWSTADRVLEKDADVITTLSSRNIHTVVFDKETMSFGDIKEATMTTTEDNVADVNPSISYFKDEEGNEQMFMYYTKSEYERTDGENGLIGDAIYPYSLCAYLYYDFENDTWARSYTADEKQTIMDNMGMDETEFADYEANWYGQGFLDVAPKVYINEKLDEDGYWTEKPEIIEVSGDYSLVTSIDVITYNDLALVAYVLDYDGTTQTVNDRDVYLQIYDYLDGRFTHPVMITSDNVEDGNVRFYRTGEGDKASTYLAWISDGDIKTVNISHAVRESLTKANTESGQEYYYIEKTAEKNYMPAETVVSADTGKEDDKNVISEFDVKTNGKYTYIVWSDTLYVHADEANGVTERVENQLYACRYDSEKQVWTGRIALTDEAGANYTNAAFAIKDDGNLLAMAAKGMSKVVESESADSYATEDIDGRALVGMDIVLDNKTIVNVDDFNVEDANAGETTSANYTITNGNFDTIDNLTIQIVDAEGNVVNSTTEADLLGGKSATGMFDITLPEDAKTVDYTLNVLDAEGNLIAAKNYTKELTKSAGLSDVYLNFTDSRDKLLLAGSYINTGEQYTTGDTLKLTNGEATLGAIEIPALAPGEIYEFEKVIDVKESMFVEKVETDGAVSETFTLKLEGTDAELSVSEVTDIARYASAAQMERINKLTGLKYKSLKLTEGSKEFIYDAVNSEQFKMTEDDVFGYDMFGLNVQFASDNDGVAYMNEYGVIYGDGKGTANVQVTITPTPERERLVGDFETIADDNYVTLPKAAISKMTIPVTVEEAKEEKPSDDTADKPSDDTTDKPSDDKTEDDTDKSTEDTTTKPSGTVGGDNQTGDSSPMSGLMLILCASCLAFLVVAKKRNIVEKRGN